MAKYVVFDGFEMSAGSENIYGIGVNVWNGSGAPAPLSTHHIWVLNSIIHGFGQTGIEFNDGEFLYAIHNRVYDNSLATCDAQGSGIAYVAGKAFPSYAETPDDSRYGPFRNVVAWNVAYNNGLSPVDCPSSRHTQGNGIFIGSFDNGGPPNPTYPYASLAAFNVSYNNGALGIAVSDTSHVTMANNSAYNNALDPMDQDLFRPQIGAQRGTDNLIINNIAYAITGPSPLDANAAFGAAGTGTDATFSNNIAFGATSMSNGDVFSCSGNQCNTNPSWRDVGSQSPGSQTTLPSGDNFALNPSSPAIGYGLTKSYLPAQSVDIGACHHSLSTCP
jgi:hypothetical protein